MLNELICLECGEKLSGRADKKFCDDQCRSLYNNKQKRDTNNLVRNVNNVLRKNRRILAEMNPKGKTVTTKEKMLQAGFNFNYHTNIFKTKNEKTYYFCYDQGFIYTDDGKIALVQKQEYVDA